MTRRPLSLLGLFLLLLTMLGCTASSSGSASAGADPGYVVSLETQPAPMQSGRVATVTLRVQQPDGTPLTGGQVTFVPEHTSMSMGKSTVTAQERDPGVYAAEYVPAMDGKYRVTVQIAGPKGKAEKILDAEAR